MAEHGFALIGLGAVSGLHADAIQRLPNAVLRAVCDINESRARAVAAERGCDWATDHRALLDRSDITAVDITTWSGLHGPIGAEFARAGKHVITTKPIDVRLEVIDELIETCDANRVKLAAVHQSRALEPYRRLKEAIEQGRLGRILMGHAYCKWLRTQAYYDSSAWRGTYELDGGGCLMNQGIHYVDLLLWYLGQPVTVAGHTATLCRDIEVEDSATASLRFASGALGSIEGATCLYQGQPARVEVHGERGNVSIAGDEIVLWDVEGEETIHHPPGAIDGSSDPAGGMVNALDAHIAQIGDFLRAIDEDREPELSGREARRAVEVILAVYRSSRTGQVVPLPLEGNSDPRAV